MGVIAEISLSSTTFGLGRLLADEASSRVEFERVVTLGTRTRPLFWIEHADFGQFERRLAACEAVEEYTVLDRLDDRALYTVAWNSAPDGVFTGLDTTDAVVLEARWYTEEQWTLKLLFPSHERLSAFHDFCLGNEIRSYARPNQPARRGDCRANPRVTHGRTARGDTAGVTGGVLRHAESDDALGFGGAVGNLSAGALPADSTRYESGLRGTAVGGRLTVVSG